MNRRELLRRLVLDSICNDYENVDQIILREVAEQGIKCGLTIERSEVVEALTGLIGDGLATAYDLSVQPPLSQVYQGVPPLDVVEDDYKIYFYITKKGRDFQVSDETWWPFDDDGNLRQNWRLDLAQ